MNCQQIQDLLPLYSGSDLEESRARLVAAHVQSCERCADMARDYRETRQLLQTFIPPPFTEDFYAEMRQSVWQNVEKKSSGPAYASRIGDLFRPRLAWAVATAVLIAGSVVGIYLIGRRNDVRAPALTLELSTTDIRPAQQLAPSAHNDASSARMSVASPHPRSVSVHERESRRKRNTIHDRVNLAALSAVAPVSPAALPPSELSDSRQPTHGSSDARQTPVRIEIQTKNPNIRIIWFPPRDTKSPSLNSKGI